MGCRSVGELEITLRIPAVVDCCSRASASSPLAWESSLVSAWFLRSAEARSSVGEAVMTHALPMQLARTDTVRAVSWRRLASEAVGNATQYGGSMECPDPGEFGACRTVSAAHTVK